MLGDLFVVVKAKLASYFKGMKDVVGVTQGAAKQVNASAKEMEGALTSAFSGQIRNNINNLSENISFTRDNIVQLKEQLKLLLIEQKKQKEGTEEYNKTARAIGRFRKTLFEAQQDLAKYNITTRDQKKALADSRLAAEDNSSAMEATSRAVNAASQALLLLGDNSDTLKPLLKGVSIAMAGVNAVIAVQNLRLRENAVFAKVTAGAQNLLRSAFIGATGAATAFKTVLASIGIGAAILIIGQLISKIMEITAATSEAEESQKKFNESYAKFGGAEITKVKLLIGQINDVSLALDTRKSALKKLQDIFPAYFQNLNDEKILSGQVVIETNKLTNAILKNAKAKALQNRLTEVAEETLTVTQKSAKALDELNKTTKEYEENASNGADVSTFYTSKINRLRNEITEASERLGDLSAQSKKYSEEIDRINQETDPFIGADSEEPKKVKKIKEGTAKELKQSINNQQKLLIQEVELNKQRLLTTATTELDRAKIINAAEEDILKIKEQGILQQINAQNLGSNEATLLFRQLELERLKIAEEAEKRIKTARDKETDSLVKAEEDKQKAIQDANLGLLQLREQLFTVLQGINAKQFNDGLKSEKDYIEEQKQLTIDWLKEKIRLQRAAGVDTLKTEQELANALISQDKSNKKELTKEQQIFARRTSQLFQQAFSQLGQDLVNSINDSLQRAFQGTSESSQLELDILKAQQRELEQTMKDATQSELQMLQNRRQYLENEQKIAEATESNMQKLFQSILTGVADFLEQLGIGLVSAALATEAFQKLLVSNPLAAAAAGGAAIVAAAGVRAILAKGVKFADGGIVSGPTLGLVGEYPGASTNPEVIAPLDKLKSLIGGGNGDSGGFIAETRISGRDLAIVLNRYNKDLQRG